MLEGDIRFWREVLESSDILISKMIATAALNRHFKWGNLILRNLPAREATSAIPDEWRVALSDSERSMVRCMAGEWHFTLGVVRSEFLQQHAEDQYSLATKITAWMTEPLLQPQDMLNRYAEYYSRVAETFNVPLDQYEAALQRATELSQRMASESFPPRSPYNIMGSILLAGIGRVDLGSYAGRVGDIEGVRRAAIAAVTLRGENVKAPDVPARLAAIPLQSPYRDQPLLWDDGDHALVFRGLQEGDRGEHRIYY